MLHRIALAEQASGSGHASHIPVVQQLAGMCFRQGRSGASGAPACASRPACPHDLWQAYGKDGSIWGRLSLSYTLLKFPEEEFVVLFAGSQSVVDDLLPVKRWDHVPMVHDMVLVIRGTLIDLIDEHNVLIRPAQ